MNEIFWTGDSPNPDLSRKYRKMASSYDLERKWRDFLCWANCLYGDKFVGLYSSTRGLLAYAFEVPQYKDPGWDEFDRYRVRVTGAMPLKFKLKLIEEVKAGKRHMRSF